MMTKSLSRLTTTAAIALAANAAHAYNVSTLPNAQGVQIDCTSQDTPFTCMSGILYNTQGMWNITNRWTWQNSIVQFYDSANQLYMYDNSTMENYLGSYPLTLVSGSGSYWHPMFGDTYSTFNVVVQSGNYQMTINLSTDLTQHTPLRGSICVVQLNPYKDMGC